MTGPIATTAAFGTPTSNVIYPTSIIYSTVFLITWLGTLLRITVFNRCIHFLVLQKQKYTIDPPVQEI